jgi:hypothetical protein
MQAIPDDELQSRRQSVQIESSVRKGKELMGLFIKFEQRNIWNGSVRMTRVEWTGT